MSDTKKSKSIIQQKIEEGATVEQLKNVIVRCHGYIYIYLQ